LKEANWFLAAGVDTGNWGIAVVGNTANPFGSESPNVTNSDTISGSSAYTLNNAGTIDGGANIAVDSLTNANIYYGSLIANAATITSSSPIATAVLMASSAGTLNNSCLRQFI
jgi:hypothetical protein